MTVIDLSSGILAACARELLCLVDDDGRLLAAIGPWHDVLGRSGVELEGARLADLAEEGLPTLRAFHEAVTAAVATGVATDVTVSNGGDSRVYDVSVRRMDSYVGASFRDVTEQRQAERLLAEANERLRAANQELQRSNDELQRFAYVASHDLSEPLRMVTSYCALLVNEFSDQLDDRARQYLAFAADGAVRMRTLIDDLLAYSRVSWVADEPVRVELADVVTDALRDLGPMIAESGGEVVVGSLPAVLGHAGQLGQLVTNLVGNSVKFRTDDVPPRIHVSARRVGRHVTLSVADNGIGIAERHRDRIFVMFKRLHGRARYEGNGIGLSMCKRIAEQHGGDIWVEASPGGGSIFRVTLPAAMPLRSHHAGAGSGGRGLGHGDDDGGHGGHGDHGDHGDHAGHAGHAGHGATGDTGAGVPPAPGPGGTGQPEEAAGPAATAAGASAGGEHVAGRTPATVPATTTLDGAS